MRKLMAVSVAILGLSVLILLGPLGGPPWAHAQSFDERDLKGVYVGVSSGAKDRVAVWRFELNGMGGGNYVVSPHPTTSSTTAFTYLVSPTGGVQFLAGPLAECLFVYGYLADRGREIYGVVASQCAWGADYDARTIVLVKQ